MKTGFSLGEKLHRENPVFITGMGLQCDLNPGFGGPWNKSWTETFLKNGLTGFQKLFFFRLPMNTLLSGKAKLDGSLFWVFIIVKKPAC